MIAILAAIALANGSQTLVQGDFTARMRESAAAAQALEGPLDGGWTLEDRNGRPLYLLQITDPAGRGGSLDGAWRAAGGPAGAGPIEFITRRGDGVRVRFDSGAPGRAILLALRRQDAAVWTGWMRQDDLRTRVALRRLP